MATSPKSLYPPSFWTLGDRTLLESAIELADAAGIDWTAEVEGQIEGETSEGEVFRIDPERPGKSFACTCQARSRRKPKAPCTHAVAGFIHWWQSADRPRRVSRAQKLRNEVRSHRPLTAAGAASAYELPFHEVQIDPAAGRLATFALLGTGLAQVRVSSAPDDPLELTVELLGSDGVSIGEITPDRSLALPILEAMPHLLGESVRWDGEKPPVRISDRGAEWIIHASLNSRGRVAVQRAIRLPHRDGRRRRVLTGRDLEKNLVEGGVCHSGVLYTVDEEPIPFNSLFGTPLEPGRSRMVKPQEMDHFLRDQVPILRRRKLIEGDREIIDAEVGAPIELAGLDVDIHDSDFSVVPKFTAEGEEVPLETILGAQRSDGWVSLDNRWFELDRSMVIDLGLDRGEAHDDDRLHLDRFDYLRVRGRLPDETPIKRTKAAEAFEKAIGRFTPPKERKVPGGYKGTLRPYQQEGYAWLLFLRDNQLPGILADDMGLGKTHQLICYLLAVAADKPGRPSLVVCPRTVLDHWIDKIDTFAPSLKPLVHFGPDRGDIDPRKTGLVLTTYGLLARDQEKLAEIEWESVILDEAQRIKNASTKTSQAARSLEAKHHLVSTGTPIENHLAELWSIFQFLAPGFLGDEKRFRDRFVKPLEGGNVEVLEELRRLIEPFKLRRLKKELLHDLPPKVDDVRFCRLSELQAELYKETLEGKARPLVDDLKNDKKKVDFVHIFSVLSRLKRICDHPYLVLDDDDEREMESGKFEVFREVLQEAIESEHKVVVFSQYLEMLDLIAAELKRAKVPYVELKGQTRDRAEVVRRFQEDDDCRIFLGSLLAGGVGIDLTAASVVIHYDRWWNAAREDQATDRVHRIGQESSVQSIHLVTTNTLEESIDRMIRSKRELFETVIQPDEASFKSFSREELIELLGGLF